MTRVSQNLEQKLGQAGQAAAQQFKETREQLQTQSRSLADELIRNTRELYTEIERVAASIEARKPDRQFLAAMFVKLASALQAGPPGTETRRPPELKEVKKVG
jgi:hypothetical protein